MTNNPILYHGTNSRDYIHLTKNRQNLVRLSGRKWTTHPGEAMNFSCLMAKQYRGEMVVIVLPEWDPQHFHDLGERLAVNRGDPCHWYESRTLDCQKPDSIEQRSVKVYTQNQLEDYVRTYCTDTEWENLWLQGYMVLLEEHRQNI